MVREFKITRILKRLGYFILLLNNTLTYSSPFLTTLQPIFTFTTGASLSQLKQSQSFQPIDLCIYSYNSDFNATNSLLGGFIGSEITRNDSWKWIAGLGYYQPSSITTKGILIQGADSASNDTFNYTYQIQNQQFLAENKLYWIKNKITPFLMLGLGVSSNRASDYQTNVPPFLQFTPVFSNHTQTNFTYVLGSGVDIPISKSFQIGVAYRFTDLGASITGNAQIDGIAIASKLKQSHLLTHQILAQFTFTPWRK